MATPLRHIETCHDEINNRGLRTGAAVEFKGDAPITRMVFRAVDRAASPEPFIRILLSPGQTQEWSSHYRFSVATP